MLGLDFEVIVSGIDERAVQEHDPVRLARTLARMKAEAVAKDLKEEALVIGADTLVSFEGRIIGKARDEEDAFRILSGFSGKVHEQITGICIINTRSGKVWEDHEITRAKVRDLSEKEIRDFIGTGEPMEGAGAYTTRAHKMLFESIDGSWTNVVGLPMEKFIPLLGKALTE
jgi:septum formation protein